MSYFAKPLAVGTLCNVALGEDRIWHGAQVVEVSEDGKLFSVKLLEASDPFEVGQQLGGFFSESVAYFGEEEPANIKPAQVFIMRAERPADLSWLYRGEDRSVSHVADSLVGAVASLLTCYSGDVAGDGQEFPETPEAAAALLTAGRYVKKYEDGRQVQYWYLFTGQ
jgi:hypothetical protein